MIARIYVTAKEPSTDQKKDFIKDDIIFCHPTIGMSLEFAEFQSKIAGLKWEMAKDIMHIDLAPIYGNLSVLENNIRNSGFGERK